MQHISQHPCNGSIFAARLGESHKPGTLGARWCSYLVTDHGEDMAGLTCKCLVSCHGNQQAQRVPNSQKQRNLTKTQRVKCVYCPALLTRKAGHARRNHSTNTLWKPFFQKRLQYCGSWRANIPEARAKGFSQRTAARPTLYFIYLTYIIHISFVLYITYIFYIIIVILIINIYLAYITYTTDKIFPSTSSTRHTSSTTHTLPHYRHHYLYHYILYITYVFYICILHHLQHHPHHLQYRQDHLYQLHQLQVFNF